MNPLILSHFKDHSKSSGPQLMHVHWIAFMAGMKKTLSALLRAPALATFLPSPSKCLFLPRVVLRNSKQKSVPPLSISVVHAFRLPLSCWARTATAAPTKSSLSRAVAATACERQSIATELQQNMKCNICWQSSYRHTFGCPCQDLTAANYAWSSILRNPRAQTVLAARKNTI